MKTCPSCGASLREGARFCPRCMTVLIDKTVIADTRTSPKKRLIVSIGLFLLCAAIVLALLPL